MRLNYLDTTYYNSTTIFVLAHLDWCHFCQGEIVMFILENCIKSKALILHHLEGVGEGASTSEMQRDREPKRGR